MRIGWDLGIIMKLRSGKLRELYNSQFPHGARSKTDESLTKRLERAISWIERAERYPEKDWHARFIYLWIALNAMYGQKKYDARECQEFGEREDRRQWLQVICKLEAKLTMERNIKCLIEAIDGVLDDMRSVLTDVFLSNNYWNGKYNGREQKSLLVREADGSIELLNQGYPFNVLDSWLSRLAVLRNQVFHGCSSDQTSKNRDSFIPAVCTLSAIVPLFAMIMIEAGKSERWSGVPYPPKGSLQHPWC